MSVPAVQKASLVLGFIAEHSGPVGTSAVGRALDLPKSTVHGLCTTLADVGLLIRDSESRYRIGPQAVVLAQSYLSGVEPWRRFDDEAGRIPSLAVETLVLAVLDDVDVVYVATRPGRQTIAITYKVGLRLPASCTSTGKALLSTFPEERVAMMFRGKKLKTLTPRSISDVATLQAELAKVRQAGYATDIEGTAPGMYCLGAPILDSHGHAVAAVGVTAVFASLDEQRIAALADGIQKLAAALS